MITNPDSFDTLFDRYVVASFDRQTHFHDVVGGPQVEWGFSMPDSTVRFATGQRFPGQLLGTEMGDTWTWAWAAADNPEIPGHALNAARALRRIGEAAGIAELTQPDVSVLEINGTLASLLAVGLLGGNGYARGPFDGGAVYALVASPVFPPNVVDPLDRVSDVFPRAVRALSFNHRRAFAAYLEHYSLAYRQDPTRPDALVYVVDSPDGEPALTATFSHLGRLISFQGTLDSLV